MLLRSSILIYLGYIFLFEVSARMVVHFGYVLAVISFGYFASFSPKFIFCLVPLREKNETDTIFLRTGQRVEDRLETDRITMAAYRPA